MGLEHHAQNNFCKLQDGCLTSTEERERAQAWISWPASQGCQTPPCAILDETSAERSPFVLAIILSFFGGLFDHQLSFSYFSQILTLQWICRHCLASSLAWKSCNIYPFATYIPKTSLVCPPCNWVRCTCNKIWMCNSMASHIVNSAMGSRMLCHFHATGTHPMTTAELGKAMHYINLAHWNLFDAMLYRYIRIIARQQSREWFTQKFVSSWGHNIQGRIKQGLAACAWQLDDGMMTRNHCALSPYCQAIVARNLVVLHKEWDIAFCETMRLLVRQSGETVVLSITCNYSPFLTAHCNRFVGDGIHTNLENISQQNAPRAPDWQKECISRNGSGDAHGELISARLFHCFCGHTL